MYWEFRFLSALSNLDIPGMDAIMSVLSFLGNGGLVWFAVAILLLAAKKKRACLEILLAMALTFVIGNLILKNLIDRARPYETYQSLVPFISLPGDASFPSGHTMNGFTSAYALYHNDKKYGRWAFLLASLIAFSRLYNLVHYPTDVLAGILVGILCAGIVHTVMNRYENRRQLRMMTTA